MKGFARADHATRGLIYLVLGGLAAASALSETRPPSMAGAFSILDHLPGGWLLVLAVAFGLGALGGWRLMQALLDLKGCGWHALGLLRRAGLLAETALYGGLALVAAAISMSRNTEAVNGTNDGATFAVAWTARVLDWPLGHWIIGAVGLGAIALSVGQLVIARGTAFEDIDACGRLLVVIRLVGRIGFFAKGLIFAVSGMLFLIAAWRVEASGVGGMRAALTALAGVPLGRPVLLAVSVGLTLHGAFSLMKAYRHRPVTT